jgi:hypothetical protein
MEKQTKSIVDDLMLLREFREKTEKVVGGRTTGNRTENWMLMTDD